MGGIHANADGSNRLFEIALCAPGEGVSLVPEPKNTRDPSAVAVISERGVQIGFLGAERCGWIGAKIRLGENLCAVFQVPTKGGALIRDGFAGETPALLEAKTARSPSRPQAWDADFYPDEIWPTSRSIARAAPSAGQPRTWANRLPQARCRRSRRPQCQA